MAFDHVAADERRVARGVFVGQTQALAHRGVAGLEELDLEAVALQVADPVFAAAAARIFPDLQHRQALGGGGGGPGGQGGGQQGGAGGEEKGTSLHGDSGNGRRDGAGCGLHAHGAAHARVDVAGEAAGGAENSGWRHRVAADAPRACELRQWAACGPAAARNSRTTRCAARAAGGPAARARQAGLAGP